VQLQYEPRDANSFRELLYDRKMFPTNSHRKRRTANDPNATTSHDETSADTSCEVAGQRERKWKALDTTCPYPSPDDFLTPPGITVYFPPLKAPEDMSAEKFRTSMIGYSLHYESSLCGMAMTQGIREKVVTIGLGFKQYAVEPRGASIEAYVESC
jgi:hypothetical protein